MSYSIGHLKRLKQSEPFSKRLNDWLNGWEKYMNISGTYIVATSDGSICDTYDKIQTYYKETGNLLIWSGCCDRSIYGNKLANIQARAWHDWHHLQNGLGFNSADEIRVGELQIADLPADWYLERLLISADVKGQILHHLKYGEFPADQRAFVIDYIENGIVTTKF